jgi:3D (Asp-Asp-Asp) domain-containing protein
MRIIRIIAIATALLGTFIALTVQASETINPDTNTKINKIFLDSFSNKNNPLLQEGVTSNSPVEVAKTAEELKNEEILAKWKAKQQDKWKSLIMEPFIVNASAYTAAADECGKSDGITSSGIKAKEGRTIACPASFPFGAKISIEGVGTFVCEDRGGAIKGNHIDIFVKTKAEAFAFGRQNLTARVIL